MSDKRYDDLMRALIPRQNPQQPTGPMPGHQGPMPGYTGQPPAYHPTPYYMGNAPIQYPVEYPRQYPVEPWRPMPEPRPPIDPRPRQKTGPSGLDVAMIIFGAACFVIILAAMLPR
jgi:hypothetical protein